MSTLKQKALNCNREIIPSETNINLGGIIPSEQKMVDRTKYAQSTIIK
ncbi:hypothetical protein ACM26V_05105 [Salipaludibacillus sp. HK11]